MTDVAIYYFSSKRYKEIFPGFMAGSVLLGTRWEEGHL